MWTWRSRSSGPLRPAPPKWPKPAKPGPPDSAATALALTFAFTARAAEVPIGEPVEKNGMQIAAIYLQAVTMEPQHAAHANTDLHLEADIHAIKGNENGFGEGLGLHLCRHRQEGRVLIVMAAPRGAAFRTRMA
ncbi:MAG: iron transporter [Alphaproteobacteria bacterium]|nr:iron transporter [Alphaproteobacteria bacterium]